MKGTSFWKKLAVGALAISFGVSIVGCNSGSENDGGSDSAYLAVDINPSVEFILKDGKVSGVTAVNDDASVLLSGETFEGLTAEEAVEKVVDLAEELGYLTDENRDVKITVAADDENYAKKMEDLAKKGVEKACGWAEINTDPRLADDRTCKKLKEEGLGGVFDKLNDKKVRLIEAIMRYDDTMTYEKGAAMSFEELADLLDDYIEEYKDLVNEELRKEFKDKMDEAYAAVETQIAALYETVYRGYSEALEQVQALQKSYKDLEHTVEMNLAQTAVDSEAVADLLSELQIDAEVVFADVEIVDADMLEKYVQKYLEKAIRSGDITALLPENETDVKAYVDDVLDRLEEALEVYDEDNYTLTQADVDAIKALVGETDEIYVGMTLEELDELVESKAEALKDGLESAFAALSDELKKALMEQIEAIKATLMDGLHAHKQNAMDALQHKIDEGKAFWEGLKQDRRPAPEVGPSHGGADAA